MPFDAEILGEKAQAHKESAYQQFLKNLSEPQSIAESLRVRRSIDGPPITKENYMHVLESFDKWDFSTWRYHDITRLGSLLQESLELTRPEKVALLSCMKPSEVLSKEAAYFNSIADMRYIYTGEINDLPLGPSEIRLQINKDGTKLNYQISNDEHQYEGEIDTKDLDLEPITPGYSPYLKENLFDILKKIPPEHIDLKISEGYFQYLFCGDDMDEKLITIKNEFSSELKKYLGEHLNETIVNLLLLELDDIDSTVIEKINPEWNASDKVKFLIKIIPELKHERQTCIQNIQDMAGVLQAKLEEGFTPELKIRAAALLGDLQGKDLNILSLAELRVHRDALNEFYSDYNMHLESLRQKVEDSLTSLETILKLIEPVALIIPQFQHLAALVNDLREHPENLMKHYTQIQQQIEEITRNIPMLEKASVAVARVGVFSHSLFSKVTEQVQAVQEKLSPRRR